MSAWEKMDTAPKDGTEVMILNGMGDVDGPAHFHCGEWLVWSHETDEEGRWDTRHPTHWMPLTYLPTKGSVGS